VHRERELLPGFFLYMQVVVVADVPAVYSYRYAAEENINSPRFFIYIVMYTRGQGYTKLHRRQGQGEWRAPQATLFPPACNNGSYVIVVSALVYCSSQVPSLHVGTLLSRFLLPRARRVENLRQSSSRKFPYISQPVLEKGHAEYKCRSGLHSNACSRPQEFHARTHTHSSSTDRFDFPSVLLPQS